MNHIVLWFVFCMRSIAANAYPGPLVAEAHPRCFRVVRIESPVLFEHDFGEELLATRSLEEHPRLDNPRMPLWRSIPAPAFCPPVVRGESSVLFEHHLEVE